MNTRHFSRSVLALCALMVASAVPTLAQDRSGEQALPAAPAALGERPVATTPELDAVPAAMTILSGTPILEVENASAVTQMRLNEDGGFVVGGVFGTGVIPTSNAGTRLMWYPRKAAFRVGYVSGDATNDGYIGNFSMAMGYNIMASGFNSTAMGASTMASGAVSTAMGSNTRAVGEYSTAMGYNTRAVGEYSTAMGFSTTAIGEYSTAMGFSTMANGEYSMVWGVANSANRPYSTAMGYGTIADGELSTAMGWFTTAQSRASLTIGRFNVIAGSTNSWVSTDPLFVAGNGSGSANRTNALTLLKNGDMSIAGSLTQSSDARLKEDVTAYQDGLATVLALNPVRYRFREGTNRPGGHQIGLVAQEVSEVLPELVRQDADGYLSVSYANLTPVLAAAVREQQAQIDALRAENEALRTAATESAELRRRLAAVESAQAALLARLEAERAEENLALQQRLAAIATALATGSPQAAGATSSVITAGND